MKNRKFITKVDNSQRPIVMKRNTDRRVIQRHWKIPGIKEKVWCEKDLIANIFSFSKFSDQYRIRHDNEKDNAFNIHDKEGKYVNSRGKKICTTTLYQKIIITIFINWKRL